MHMNEDPVKNCWRTCQKSGRNWTIPDNVRDSFLRRFAPLAQEIEQQREEAVREKRILWPYGRMAWKYRMTLSDLQLQKQSCLGKNWSVGNHRSLQCTSKRRCLTVHKMHQTLFERSRTGFCEKYQQDQGFVLKTGGNIWKNKRKYGLHCFYHYVLS